MSTLNFQLKCRGMECPPELEDAIHSKITRFEGLVPETSYMEIELTQHAKVQTRGDKEAEVILDIPGVKPVIRFVAEGETFLEAVDRILDKLDEALSERKERVTDHSYHGPAPKELLADVANKEEL
jgi:ribosomal subunit interface protein